MVYSHLKDDRVILAIIIGFLPLLLLVSIGVKIVLNTRNSLTGFLQKTIYRYIPIVIISVVAFLILNTLCSEIYCLYKYINDPFYIEGNIIIDSTEEIQRMGSELTYYHIGVSVNDIVFKMDDSNLYQKEVIDSICGHRFFRVTYIVVNGKNYIWDIELLE